MPTPTLVIHPYLKSERNTARSPQARLEEAAGLAHAIDLDVVHQLAVPLAAIRPATYFGSGKADEIGELVGVDEITLAIVDAHLSPVQQRNLERIWKCKVIDRTALILEIFGARARTHEGKLQVELAALNYQKSRLVRSWTHLERQRGGFGFLGGPGESQIEIDRRLIRDRISKVKRELEQVTRTRGLHRKSRKDVPYPVVALVGYTNAGKSTLFNRMTGARVVAMDKLFATLDPTMRVMKLPSGFKVILSDTVGFVSDLPHELVAAFRATLEEVLAADILLHVRDIAHADSEAQKDDVEDVLISLFEEENLPDNIIEVHNKIDLLPEVKPGLQNHATPCVAVSAVTGNGLDALVALIDETLQTRLYTTTSFAVPVSDGSALAWLHAHGQVLQETLEEDDWHVQLRMLPEHIEAFKKRKKHGG